MDPASATVPGPLYTGPSAFPATCMFSSSVRALALTHIRPPRALSRPFLASLSRPPSCPLLRHVPPRPFAASLATMSAYAATKPMPECWGHRGVCNVSAIALVSVSDLRDA